MSPVSRGTLRPPFAAVGRDKDPPSTLRTRHIGFSHVPPGSKVYSPLGLFQYLVISHCFLVLWSRGFGRTLAHAKCGAARRGAASHCASEGRAYDCGLGCVEKRYKLWNPRASPPVLRYRRSILYLGRRRAAGHDTGISRFCLAVADGCAI